ncbi:MAG TPA: short-chain dehydrogenase, partial [Telluria sp.]
SRPRHPQPVGTVYQPEVAARAIVFAATHERRELYVGAPSLLTILLNKAAPGLFDRLMAHRCYEQQFTDHAIAPDRPDNLFEPVPGPYGAHGSFDNRAHAHSPVLWGSEHRGLVGTALALAGLSALMVVGVRSRRPRRGVLPY